MTQQKASLPFFDFDDLVSYVWDRVSYYNMSFHDMNWLEARLDSLPEPLDGNYYGLALSTVEEIEGIMDD